MRGGRQRGREGGGAGGKERDSLIHSPQPAMRFT